MAIVPQSIRSLAPLRLRDDVRLRALAVGVGLIPPRTMHSEEDQRVLLDAARGARRVVEIGVYEGSSALALQRELRPGAELHLIDPFGHHPDALPGGWGASERATRRLRVTRAAVSVALAVAIALSVVALIERATAVFNQHVAQSRLLAAEAESVLGVDPELSTLLALRGLRIRRTDQAEAALRGALPRLQLLRTLRPAAPLYSPSFSPDGRLVLTASADGAS